MIDAVTLRAGTSAFPPRIDQHEHAHVVQFYREDGALLESLSQFISTALSAGNAAVVIATPEHREGLARHLNARGLDIASMTSSGRYSPLDASEMLSNFMVEDWPDAKRFTETIGAVLERASKIAGGPTRGVVAFGEMVARLWSQGKPEAAIRLEQLWNELAQTHRFSLRCAYPIGGFNRQEHGNQFLKICELHSLSLPDESYASLVTDEERLRNVTDLQQKAEALVTEMAERKKAQEALRRRELDLADLLENAIEGVQQTGADQRILWANKAMLNLLGYTAAEYVGHKLSEFYVEKAAFDEFWALLMRREDIYDFPAELRGKDGSAKHVVIHSNGLWEGEKLVHTRCFIRDVSEHKRMEQALLDAQDELENRVRERTAELHEKNLQNVRQAETLAVTNQSLRELSARLLQVRDEERRRIARDLHDSTGQALALLSMNLSALATESNGSNPGITKSLAENVELVKSISAELRTISYLLHPPLLDEMGLESAIRWYVDGFGQRSGISVDLQLSGNLGRLSRSLEIAIFRVLQECLANIHRHSESPTATIRMEHSAGRLILDVEDQGKGIAQEKLAKITSSGLPGVGLRGMQERIKDFRGEVEITSPEKGTHVRVVVPLEAAAPELHNFDGAAAVAW